MGLALAAVVLFDVGALVALGAVAITRGDDVRSEVSRPGDTPLGELVAGRVVRREFTATADRLTRVDVQADTFGRLNTQRVNAAIQDPASERPVRSATADARGLADARGAGDPRFLTFRFAAIEDSGGRSFVLVITSADGVPGASIGLVSDGRDLVIRTYAAADGGARLALLLERSDAYKPAWLSRGVLVALALVALALGAVAIGAGLDLLVRDLPRRRALVVLAASPATLALALLAAPALAR